MKNEFEILNTHVFVTKLAGFEHSKYIQHNETKTKNKDTDIPLVQGKNIRNGEFVEEFEWYINEKISNNLKRSKLEKDCILIPYVGSNLGEVGIFYHKYDCHLASNIAKIELIDDYFDLDYLKYYFQSDLGQSYLFKDKQGSAQPNITMDSIRNTPVLNIPKKEQLKISKIIKSIENKIRINIEIVKDTEKILNRAFDFYFKPEIFKENGKDKIKNLFLLLNGFPFSTSDYVKNGKYKIYTIKNVQDNKIISKVENCIDELPQNIPDECILKPKDILLSLTGNVGRVGLVYEEGALLNQRVLKIIPKKNIGIAFTYCFFKDGYIRKMCENLSTGTSQKNLSPENIANIGISIPSLNKITKFNSEFDKFVQMIVDSYLEIEELTYFKKILLQLIFDKKIIIED